MLKNLLALTFSIFCFFSIWQLNSESNLSKYGNCYETYTVKSTSTSKIVSSDKLKLGNSFLKTGESLLVLGVSPKDILEELNAKIIFTENVCGGQNIYAYSNKLKNRIMLNGGVVNLQIFVSSEKTVIGTPMIFGSF